MSGGSRVQPARRPSVSAAPVRSPFRSLRPFTRLPLDGPDIDAPRSLHSTGLVVEPAHVREVDLVIELRSFVRTEIAPVTDRGDARLPGCHLGRSVVRVAQIAARVLDGCGRIAELAVPW